MLKGFISHSGLLLPLFLPFFLILGLAGLSHGRDLREMISEYKELVRENRAKGRDTAEAVQLAERAKKANDAGDMAKAGMLLEQAISALKGNGPAETAKGAPYAPAGVKGELKDTPFGIHDPAVLKRPVPRDVELPAGADRIEDIKASGASWVRYAGASGLVWDLIEVKKGEYDWSKTDYLYGQSYYSGLRMFVSVFPYNRMDGKKFYVPNDMHWYAEFLTKAVERYDGDGIGDAPGSPVVDVWQIGNELDTPIFWLDKLENYPVLLRESYKAVKKANPLAKVAISGMATPRGLSMYSQVLDMLKEDGLKGQRWFDIFDLHWSGQFGGDYKEQTGGYRFDDTLKKVNAKLEEAGYGGAPIWITEMSDYSGKPKKVRVFGPALPNKTEEEQAVSLLKMYVYGMAHGVKKSFWVTLTEWYGFGGEGNAGGYFDNVGLIRNPLAGGRKYKKLAYHTYKKMTEILGDADLASIKTLQENGSCSVYRFVKHGGKNVWVAWSDSGACKAVITGVRSPKAIITPAVPNASTGEDAGPESFGSSMTAAPGGSVNIEIGKTPVYVAEE